jgi:Ca2+-dependent lipid-binding protein
LTFAAFSSYNPTWNENFIVSVENEASPVTFHVMDWNRVEKHELVGVAMISSAELRSLLDEETGYECQLVLPVIKSGTLVEGHDRHKCQLNLLVKVLKAAPRAAVAPKKKRVRNYCLVSSVAT